ncbi:MAG: AMP-binding protein [Bacteroidaceae bacterium]|nr:AMP-binding protein [Bacteroidaceae bacterium]
MTLSDFYSEWNDDNAFIKVRTSGSTGKPKEMLVEKKQMLASARITCDFLGLKSGDTALLCMPLDYIAGKMVVVRSIERGLRLIDVEPSSHPLRDVAEIPTFAAMVPMQVIKSLQVPEEAEKLRQIKQLIIGGGAIDSNLAETLKSFPNNVWSTYGMTETLSHIALRRLNGDYSSLWYTPFPSVKISISKEGTLVIDAPSVCSEELITNDIAEINERGQFRIIGRRDNTINTGGVKVQIEEVERLLTEESGLKDCFRISWREHQVLGQEIVMLIDASITEQKMALLKSAISTLPKYWQPKDIVAVDALPMTETGKPDRARTRLLLRN